MLTFKTPKTAQVHEATLKEKLLNMDPVATVLIMAALACIILPLQYAGVSHAWDSSVVIGLIVGFVAICAALAAVEIWQGERAMLTPRIMAKRTVWASGTWGFFFAGAYFVTLYYLPIYFQSIDNVSPIASGVRSIPLIVMFSVATFGSGKAITMTGHATPYMLAGSVFVTVGAGLLYTLDIGTSTGKWAGYQIIAGFGYGLALQVPVVVAQAFAEPADIAPTTAIIICKSSFLSPSVQLANYNRDVQFIDPWAQLFCSLPGNPPLSTRSWSSFAAPRPTSIPAVSQAPVRPKCTAYSVVPTWMVLCARTPGVSKLCF